MLYIELIAASLTLLCVYLTAKRHIFSWPVGLLAVSFYIIVFIDAKLYADLLLQIFFIVQGVIGWIEWNRNKEVKESYIIKVERLTKSETYLYSISAFFSYIVVAQLFNTYTDAALPFVDSFCAIMSLLANFLLVKRKIESWKVWMLVDCVYISLFFYKGLFISSMLYFILLILAIKGYYEWKKKIT